MTSPPEYMYSLLHTIESTVLFIKEEFVQLTDKDVEYAFNQLTNYHQQLSKGKKIEEPLSSSDRRQALIDEILNGLEEREKRELDDTFIMNVDYQPNGAPIPNLQAFYATAFKRLKQSVRFWRKNNGNNGYLRYILENVPR